MSGFVKVVIFLFTLLISNSVLSKPYTPETGEQIIRVFSSTNEIKEINALRDSLKVNKNDFNTLDQIINSYMALGRENADPRYFGYAEAVIKPYLDDDLPEKILIHWADILQHRHDFEQSLKVLNNRINKNTKNAQVYLMRAIIHISRGEYNIALSNCKSLITRASHLVATACVAQVKSLMGQLQDSFDVLKNTLERNKNSDTEETLWALTLLGDMAMREGDYPTAEFYYQQGLQLNEKDYYILANYADLLLKQKKYIQVNELISDFTYVDSLLLRLSQAGLHQSGSDGEQYIERLEVSYQLNEQRGERAHLRDQAMFYAEVKKDYSKAFELAKVNWIIQKEPADAKLILSLALKMGDITQAKKVYEWVKLQQTEDIELDVLLAQVENI